MIGLQHLRSITRHRRTPPVFPLHPYLAPCSPGIPGYPFRSRESHLLDNAIADVSIVRHDCGRGNRERLEWCFILSDQPSLCTVLGDWRAEHVARTKRSPSLWGDEKLGLEGR